MRNLFVIVVLALAALPSALGQAESEKTTQNETARDVTLLNQSFGEAQVQHDIAKLDGLLADDFSLINPAGKLLNKAQFLVDLSSGDLRYESLNYDDIGLRTYRDVALVTGRVVRKGQYKGQDNSGQFRFIHVFVKHQGRWQITIAQATRISQ